MFRYTSALQSPDLTQRRAAIKKVCQLGAAVPPSALDILLPLLQDTDDAMREGAAEALGNVGRGGGASVHSILVVLHRMLASADLAVRMRAAQVIGRIGPNARLLIPALTAALRDKDLIFCHLAAEALTRIGPEALDPLERLLDDPDCRVRREARWAFNKLNGKTVTENCSDTHILHLNGKPGLNLPKRHAPTSVRPANRRTNVRHRSGREIFYRFLGDLGHELWWRGQIRDVSMTGLGLIISRPSKTGARLTIDLQEAGLARRAVARVAHCSRAGSAWLIGCTLSRPLTAEEVQILADSETKQK
jgi:hypothetical protein